MRITLRDADVNAGDIEPDEWFRVQLSDSVGATLAHGGAGWVTVVDNDTVTAQPQLVVCDAIVDEGAGVARFVATLGRDRGASSAAPVSRARATAARWRAASTPRCRPRSSSCPASARRRWRCPSSTTPPSRAARASCCGSAVPAAPPSAARLNDGTDTQASLLVLAAEDALNTADIARFTGIPWVLDAQAFPVVGG